MQKHSYSPPASASSDARTAHSLNSIAQEEDHKETRSNRNYMTQVEITSGKGSLKVLLQQFLLTKYADYDDDMFDPDTALCEK